MVDFVPGWMQQSPALLFWIIPVLAFMEACLGIGLFVSGLLLLSTASVLYSQELVDLSVLACSAFFGAMLGDHVSYYGGYWLGPRLHKTRLFQRHHKTTARAESLFKRSAGFAVIIGRLIPAVRSLTPMMAAISGVRPGQFLRYDLVACSIWTTGLVLLVLGINQGLAGI